MAQYELDLRDYGRILIKRKKVIIFATLLVGFITFIITPQPKSFYKAKSSVRVTQSSTMAGLFVQAISYSKWNNLETQAKIIRSLPVVAQTAQRMGKVDSTKTVAEIMNSEKDIAIVNEMLEMIITQQFGKTDIIEIITQANKPEEAKQFANDLADVFVEYSNNEKNQQVDQAAQFIYDQLMQYDKKLEEAERRLEEFKRANIHEISLVPDETGSLQRELERVSIQRKQMEIQIDQLINRQGASQNSYIDMFNVQGSGTEGGGQLSAIGVMNKSLTELQMEKEALLIYQTNKSPEIQDLEKQIQKLIADLIREYDVQLEALRLREEEILAKLDKLPLNDLTYDRLMREKNINEEIYSLLRTNYQEARIKQSERVREMSVVEYSTYSQEFIKGGKWSKTVLGLVVGLLLGLVVAFVLETLDTSIGAIQDVEEYLKTTVLGVIPHFDKEEVRAKLIKNNPQAANDQYLDFHSILITQFRPKSPIAEAYRTLATNIDFVRLNKEGANEFVVTSATMQEGKSTTLSNLAIAMAQLGHRTLFIGCNLRRPSEYKIFGLEMGPGVRDISLGLIHWRDAVRTINDIALGKMSVTEELLRDGAWSRLHIVTCGAIYHNPAEIFNTPKMVEFLREAKEEFDVVLIDCPPILPVTDAAILGSKVDGVILVYQVGKVARGALKRAKAHLEAVNAKVWGVVLNDFKAEISGFAPDTAYYGKYYGGDAEEKKRAQSAWERFSAKLPSFDSLEKLTKAKLFGTKSKSDSKSIYSAEGLDDKAVAKLTEDSSNEQPVDSSDKQSASTGNSIASEPENSQANAMTGDSSEFYDSDDSKTKKKRRLF